MLQRGLVDFVIKLYPQGAMSQVLAKLEVGQTLDFKGPKGRFKYERGSKKAIGGLRSCAAVLLGFQLVLGMGKGCLRCALHPSRCAPPCSPPWHTVAATGTPSAPRPPPCRHAGGGSGISPMFQVAQQAAHFSLFLSSLPCSPLCLPAGMLAGGSGITPMFQVAQQVLRDPNDDTPISLIYANVTGGWVGGWVGFMLSLLAWLALSHRPAGAPA